MTEVGDFSSSCDGTIGPEGCSGLAIVSKYPFVEVKFHGYSDHGDAWWGDGEYLARKVNHISMIAKYLIPMIRVWDMLE